MHTHTKYEVSMFKLVARRGVQTTPMTSTMPTTMHDGQSMIVFGSLVDKSNEPKRLNPEKLTPKG